VIDYFALTLVHGLLLVAYFRLVQDDALDPAAPPPSRRKQRKSEVELAQNNHEGNQIS